MPFSSFINYIMLTRLCVCVCVNIIYISLTYTVYSLYVSELMEAYATKR